MTDQLKNALGQILTLLTAAAQQAGSLAKEQLPLLVQEYLRWGIVNALIGVLIGVSILTGFLVFARLLRQYKYDADGGAHGYESDANRFVGRVVIGTWVLPIFGFIFGWSVIITCVTKILYIWIAPRVYLLEQVRELVK